MPTKHRPAVAAAFALGLAALLALPTSAAAEPDVPVGFVFAEPTVAIEYGQYWGFSGAATGSIGLFPPNGVDPTVITVSGAPSYKPGFQTVMNLGKFEAYIWTSDTQPALNAGSYTISLATYGVFTNPGETLTNYRVTSDPNAVLTIAKAPMAVDFRILADTNNRDGAVISGRLTGTFANDYSFAAGYPSSAVGPGGSWAYTITDADGEVALEKTLTTEPGDPALASSFYWADAEPGETYTGTIVFTPDTATAGNFAITQAPEFSYTAPELQRPVPVSTLAPVAEPAPEESADFAVPLWLLILVGLLALGLTATVVVLSLRYVRLRQEPDPADDVSPTPKELVE